MRKLLFAALLVAAAGLPAAAQMPGGGPGMPGTPMHEAMRKARSDDIALLIGLRPDQRAGLDAVLQMPAPPRGVGQMPMRGSPEAPPPSFGDRITDMEARAGEARQRVAAIKAFYQGLDPQQRARFEAVMRLARGPRAGFGPGGADGGPRMMHMMTHHDGAPAGSPEPAR